MYSIHDQKIWKFSEENLPSEGLRLGSTKSGKPVYIPFNEIDKPILILGDQDQTTAMSAQIIAQVIEFSNYFPIIFSRNLEISNSFLDWNYHVLKPYEDCFSINPILPGPELEIDELEYNRILIEILSMCLELSPFNELLVRILLGKIKNKIKIPSLIDLFGEIYEFALKNNDWDDGDEILDKFDDLVWGEWFFLCGTPFETLNVENFFRQPIIISFERLTNAMEQLLLNIFITRILHSKIKRVVALVVSNACNLTDIVTYKIIKDQENLK